MFLHFVRFASVDTEGLLNTVRQKGVYLIFVMSDEVI